MAMQPGTKKWTTLATWSDADILNYFQTVQAQTPTHAAASLRKLRRIFKADGTRNPGNPFAKDEPVTVVNTVVNAPIIPEPVAPITLPTVAPNGDAAGAALAAMVAPHILASLEPFIQTAINNARPEPVTQLVVMRDAAQTVVTGTHHYGAVKLLKLVNQGLNVMLVGPAGCGKTMLAHTVATAINRKATIISLSAGMSEAQLLGRLLPLGDQGQFRYVESPFMLAYRTGGVILLDEIDAADANLLLVINAALANGGIDIEARAASGLDTRVERHPDCIIIAAANTWGSGADTQYVGRGALDASTLDRFYRLAVDYDTKIETQLASAEIVAHVHLIRTKARQAKLRRTISTRMITRLAAAVNAGISLSEACADELASWSADERAKVA